MSRSICLFTLVAAMTARATAECLPSAEIGCLNGKPFNKSQEFVCGASISNRPAIYQWARTGCCAQGVPFDKNTSFCCYNGVHDHSAGVCEPWSTRFPSSCDCWQGGNKRLLSTATVNIGQDVIDTAVEKHQDACSGPTSTLGCLNGFFYDYSTQMPCGDYLVNVNTHGCCSTAVGIKAYNLITQSCCKFGESNEVLNGGRACTCSRCTTTTVTTTTTTTTTTRAILTTRMWIGITLASGQVFNSSKFKEALAQSSGVDAKDVDIESVSQKVNVTYNFSTNVSEVAARTTIADVLGVSVGSVNINLEPEADGNTHVTATVEAESAKVAGELSTKAANATAVTAALAEHGVAATTTVKHAATQYVEVNTTTKSKTGTHVTTPTSEQLAQIGNQLGVTVSVKSVAHEQAHTIPVASTTTSVASTTNVQVSATLRATTHAPSAAALGDNSDPILSGSRRCFVSWLLLSLVFSAKASS